MFTDHSALKYLVNKPMFGGNIYRWFLLFQEFDFEIIMKPGKMNAGLDHLSRIESCEEPSNIEDGFLDTQLFRVKMVDENYEKIIQFLATRKSSEEFTMSQKKQLVVKSRDFQLIVGQLYKMGPDEIMRRYVLLYQREILLAEEHDRITRGHYVVHAIARKILQDGLWCPKMHDDAADYDKS